MGPPRPVIRPVTGRQEADLGEFTVTAYQPVSSSTLFISFHLYGSVLDKHGDEFNAAGRAQAPGSRQHYRDYPKRRDYRPDGRRVGIDQTADFRDN